MGDLSCGGNALCASLNITSSATCSDACNVDNSVYDSLNGSQSCYCCWSSAYVCCNQSSSRNDPIYPETICDDLPDHFQGPGAIAILVLSILFVVALWTIVPFMWYKKIGCFKQKNVRYALLMDTDEHELTPIGRRSETPHNLSDTDATPPTKFRL
eukprot:m.24540 g.24540  ORF g.24540 m.24540 type:complete len:156 (-) comp14636_c0_seq1:118-585(-)